VRIRGLAVFALGACGRLGFDAQNAAGGDAAGGDTAGSDATPASRCGLSTAITCDGFEAGTIDPPWQIDTSQGTLVVDATRAYRGAYSVHAHQWVGTVSSFPAADTWIDEVIVDSMPTSCAD